MRVDDISDPKRVTVDITTVVTIKHEHYNDHELSESTIKFDIEDFGDESKYNITFGEYNPSKTDLIKLLNEGCEQIDILLHNALGFKMIGLGFAAPPSFYEGKEGSLKWRVDFETGTLTVSGYGLMSDYDYSNLPTWTEMYRGKIKNIVISDGITSIGSFAFYTLSNAVSVSIPGSVKTIGDHSFAASGLTSVVIPNGVSSIGLDAFNQCNSLKSAVISGSVEYILDRAFIHCQHLSDLIIENGVRNIDNCVFMNDKDLKSVVIPASVTHIGEEAFGYTPSSDRLPIIISGVKYSEAQRYADENSIPFLPIDQTEPPTTTAPITTVPETTAPVTEAVFSGKIGNCEWEFDSNTKNLKISGTGALERGTDSEFENCRSKAKSIEIGENITSVGKDAFKDCAELKEVRFAENAKINRICENAFENSGLTGFDIPESVIRIDDGAFLNCNSMSARQTIPPTVQKIGERAFGYTFDGTTYTPVEGYTILGENDTVADKYAKDNGFKFDGEYEYKLTDDGEGAVITKYNGTASVVRVPSKLGGKKVVLADANSFAGNASITEVSFSGACDIGSYSFMNCPNLKSIKITASDMIGEFAFQNCTSLEAIGYDNRVSTKEIGEYAFFNCPSLKTVNIEIFVKKIGIFAFGYIDPSKKVDGFKLIVRDDEDNEGLRYAKQNGFYFESATDATDTTAITTTSVISDTTAPVSTEPSETSGETEPSEASYTTAPVSTEPSETSTTTAPASFEPSETNPSESIESTTATSASGDKLTVNYIPGKEQVNAGNSFKLVIQDKNGSFNTYDFAATTLVLDGIPVYSASIPDDVNPVSVQIQAYKGDVWQSQISIPVDRFSALKGKIITSDGKAYGEQQEQTTAAPTQSATVKAEKKANPIKVSVKTKTVKSSKLKKKAQKVKALTIKNAKGKITCKLKSAKRNIKKLLKISSRGVITINKWKKPKKGTYKITVRITAKGNEEYASKSITKVIKVKIK